jgi:hypothetical protein
MRAFIIFKQIKKILIYLYMILHQNNPNNVYLTLSDSYSFTSDTYSFLFRLVSQTTKEEVLFTAPNISSALTRSDEFLWTLTGAAYTNLTAGTISLIPSGEWLYDVYPQYSNTNISLTGVCGDSIERGIIIVSGTPNTFTTGTYTGSSTTYSYYQP